MISLFSRDSMREHFPAICLRVKSGDLVARDGLVLCFFMRRSHAEIAPAIWRALQTYLRAIPPQSLNWYGADDGDTLPLDDKGWEIIRKQIVERPWGIEWLVDLKEDCDTVGGFSFEYDGRKLDDPFFSHDEDSTSAVSFTVPTEYLLEHGPAHLRSLALELGPSPSATPAPPSSLLMGSGSLPAESLSTSSIATGAWTSTTWARPAG